MSKLVELLKTMNEKNSAHMDDGQDDTKLSDKQKKGLDKELANFDAKNFEKDSDKNDEETTIKSHDLTGQYLRVYFDGVDGFKAPRKFKVETQIAMGKDEHNSGNTKNANGSKDAGLLDLEEVNGKFKIGSKSKIVTTVASMTDMFDSLYDADIDGATGVKVPGSDKVFAIAEKPNKADMTAITALINKDQGLFDFSSSEVSAQKLKGVNAFNLELYLELVGTNS